jgi:hypothetical protein
VAKSKEDPEETPAPAEEPKTGRVKLVQFIYGNNATWRALTTEDLAALGLPDREPIRWDASNNWKIPLKDLDFPPEVAARVFTYENGFRIEEIEV